MPYETATMHSVLWRGRNVVTDETICVRVFETYTIEGLRAVASMIRSTVNTTHPAVPSVIDHGYTDTGEPFVVYAPLPGRMLASLLTEHGAALSPAAVSSLVDQLLATLTDLHDGGLAHGQLSAGCVMAMDGPDGPASLAEPGTLKLKLLDVGLAEHSTVAADLAAVGRITFRSLTGDTWEAGKTSAAMRALSAFGPLASESFGAVIGLSAGAGQEHFDSATEMREALSYATVLYADNEAVERAELAAMARVGDTSATIPWWRVGLVAAVVTLVAVLILEMAADSTAAVQDDGPGVSAPASVLR